MSSDCEPLPHNPDRKRRRVTLTASPASSSVHTPDQVISVANTYGNILLNRLIQININVNFFPIRALYFDLMSDIQEYNISDNTKVEFSNASLTDQEKRSLESTGILSVQRRNSSGDIHEAYIDFEALARMAFEYDLLRSVASRVEIEILEVFRLSDENTLTTSEIAEKTERPKSSISRALSQLVEKDKLTKVQAGVYRYSS